MMVHPWEVTPAEAVAIQSEMREKVLLKPFTGRIERVAGADAAYDQDSGVVRAVVCMLSFPELMLVQYRAAARVTRFPYVPGLLTFREGPALLGCFAGLEGIPDVVLFDGQGIMHPRRIGIASHLGVLLDLPTIGCAKSRLCGEHEQPGSGRGDYSIVRDRGGQVIGACVRTRAGVMPVYVSPGHRMDLAAAVRIVLSCTTRFRIPEPLRAAHHLAR